MKYKSRFFWINFLKSILLYIFIFSLARIVFDTDLEFLSARNAAYILGISFLLAALNAVRKSQDFKGLDEETVHDLQQRGFKFYIGLFGFLFLTVTILAAVFLALAAATYYLFFGNSEWEWDLLWKTLLFSLLLAALLSIYSVLSDRWKVLTYYKKRIIS